MLLIYTFSATLIILVQKVEGLFWKTDFRPRDWQGVRYDKDLRMGLLRGGSEGSFPKHSLWLKASLTSPLLVLSRLRIHSPESLWGTSACSNSRLTCSKQTSHREWLENLNTIKELSRQPKQQGTTSEEKESSVKLAQHPIQCCPLGHLPICKNPGQTE